MIGLPGQTIQDLVNDIALFAELDLDMIGVGPFLSHPDTVLANTPKPTIESILRFVAVTRLANPYSHIPATTAMGTLDPCGRQKALQCGANVFMPNVTPKQYRKHYQLYPNKICVQESPDDCYNCARALISSIGRTIAKGYGHALGVRGKG
jgi:biotin synthase